MISIMPESHRPMHAFARLSYLQSLFAHRRVLLLSNDPALADFVNRFRARYVQAVSDVPPETPWPSDQLAGPIEFRTVDPTALPFREGMFDIAIIPDIAVIRDYAAVIAEFRRAVGRRGHLVVASPNPTCVQRLGPVSDGRSVDYYELYDLLVEAFPSVQMVGQAPFVGYAISDLGREGDEGITFDTGLLEEGAEEIEWFLALCGPEPLPVDAYSVVQIPLSTVGLAGSAPASTAALDEALQQSEQLREERAQLLEQLTQMEEDLRLVEDDLYAMRRSAPTAADTAPLNEQITALEAELREVRLELGTRGVRIESLQKDLEHEKQEAEAARERAVKISKQYDDERKANQAQRIEAQMSRALPDTQLSDRLAELEVQLKQSIAARESAERSRDDIIDRTRADVAELDKLRHRLSEAENQRRKLVTHEETLHEQLALAHDEIRRLSEELRGAGEQEDLAPLLEKSRRRETELNAQVQQLRREHEAAQSQLREREAQLAQAESAGDDGDESAEVQRLEQHLKEVSAALRQAEQELVHRETLVRDLLAQMAAHTAGAVVGEAASGAVETATQGDDTEAAPQRELEQRLAAAGAEIERLTAELSRHATSASPAEDIGVRDQRIARLEAELQAATWKAEELTARCEDGQRAVDQAQEQLQAATQRAEALEIEWRSRCEALEASSSSGAGEDCAAVTQELEKAREQMHVLEEKLSAALGAIAGHHRSRVEAELALTTLMVERERVLDELDDSLACNHALEEQVAAAMGAISGHRRARVEAELQLAASDVEREQTLNELDEMIALNAAMQDSLAELQGALNGHRRSRMEAELALTAVERENEKLREEMARNDDAIADLTSRIAQLSAQPSPAESASIDEEEANARLVALQNEQHVLQTQRDALEAEVARLRDELQAAHQRVDVMEGELAARLADERQVWERQLSETQAQCEAAQTAQGEKLHILTGELRSAEAHCAHLERELHSAHEQRGHLEGELREAHEQRAHCEHLERELHSAREHCAHLERELHGAHEQRAHCEHLERELHGAREHCAHLERELHGAHEQRGHLEGELHGAREHCAHLEGELHGAHEQRGHLEGELHGARDQRDHLERELGSIRNELQQRVDELEALLATKEAEQSQRADTANESLAAITGERDALREARDHCADEVAALTAALTALRGDLAMEESRTRAAGADAARLSGFVAARDNRIAQLESELSTARTAGTAAEEVLATLRDELSQTDRRQREFHEQIAALSTECQSLQEALSVSEDRNAAMAQLPSDAAVRIEQLQEIVGQKDVALSDTMSELAMAKSAADAREKEFVAQQNKMADMSIRLSQREMDLGEMKGALADLTGRLEQETRSREELAAKAAPCAEELAAVREELTLTRDALNAAQADSGNTQEVLAELASLRRTLAEKDETIGELKALTAESQPLFDSMTAQLEEREKRATLLEKKVRMLETEIKESESDVLAWDMELKFRDSKIHSLEEEIATLQSAIRLRDPDAVQLAPVPEAGPDTVAEEEFLKVKGQLKDVTHDLEERVTELKSVRTEADAHRTRLESTRQALQDLLLSNTVDSGTALYLEEVLKALD
ncbi:MAG: hypothetical protein GX146_10335 [Myxococcales bacterium]|nr:hypothetical protein [Myxococcales bacterium]